MKQKSELAIWIIHSRAHALLNIPSFFYSWTCFDISVPLVLPFLESLAEFWPVYQSNAFFFMRHLTSFWQHIHSSGMGSPFGSFFKNPSNVHSELFSLATFIDVPVFVWCSPFSFGDIVRNKTKSNRKNNVIINKMITGDSRNWNMLLSLEWTASISNFKEVRLIALMKSTSLRQIRSPK